MIRIGIDIGGTFTDFALVGDTLKEPILHKQLTTPHDPSIAVLEGIDLLAAKARVSIPEIAEIAHGTTLVTNAVIERKGARTGMLVTAGFRDLLDMGLEHRYEMFDLRIRYPEPLVPRALRREIPERRRFDGSVEIPLDEAAVIEAVDALVRQDRIEALAVCFLHAYADPAHETMARSVASRCFPDLYVSTSADVFPYMREFERWTTTCVNAYTQPIFDRYLARIEAGLDRLGFKGRLYLMSSAGGAVTPETARRYPVRMLESGPAAGALMAAVHGRRLGLTHVLSFDLGGTTAKGALVRDGLPLRKYEMEVAHVYEHKRGSGLPLKLPVIDMTEIGAGGGSIAGVDDRGLIRVGPRSAGADPGPACYGRGGMNATVTDANLVLGYLDPDYFLGGAMRLDRTAAERAIVANIGTPLGLDTSRAAWGIHDIVTEDIARAFRIHAVERGFDCRKAQIIAFGGGGPIHGLGVARKLKTPQAIMPVGAGVMSAIGLLATPLSFEVARSLRVDLAALTAKSFTRIVNDITGKASALLLRAGVPEDAIATHVRVDMRYRGQGREIEVALPSGPDWEATFPRLPELFDRRYREVYRTNFLTEPLEIVSWKAEARGPEPTLPASDGLSTGSDPRAALKGSRQAYLPGIAQYHEVPVYDRYSLAAGSEIAGPALIEERESTCLVGENDVVRVDGWRNLIAAIAV